MFGLASIISLNEANNIIKVRDLFSSVVYDIPLQNHIHFQSMPVENDIVLYLNMNNDKIFKIVKIWQITEDPNKRVGEYLLKSGELQIQGIYGQYIYLNNKGTIKFVDSTMLNEFELSMDGFIAQLKEFQVTTYDNIITTVTDTILIRKVKKIVEKVDDEERLYSIEVTDDGVTVDVADGKSKVVIDKTGQITITGETINLDMSKVNLGKTNLAPCVTGYPNGTFPLCLVTGAPIVGSQSVKVSG